MKVVVITGTHEQPFDRLVAASDRLARAGHEVFVQYGSASTPPAVAEGASWLAQSDLDRRCREADVIVTHGGPGSIWNAYAEGKVPIVVPRDPRLREHVDRHQIEFARHLARLRRIVLVEDANGLDAAVRWHADAARDCVVPERVAEANIDRLAVALDDWAREHGRRRRSRRERDG